MSDFHNTKRKPVDPTDTVPRCEIMQGHDVAAKIDPAPRKVSFTIPGTPVAKGRPRSAIRHGKIRHYTPAETVAHERSVGWYAQQHFTAPITGPITLRIFATFVPPASWSRKNVEAHLHRPHIGLPDADNIAKAICDGLNGVAFKDDRQVYEATDCQSAQGSRSSRSTCKSFATCSMPRANASRL